MSKGIKDLYRREGVSMREAGIKKGKGIHTKKAHSCVIEYIKKGFSSDEAWKRCIGGLGKKAIKKSHQRSSTFNDSLKRRKE